MSVWDVPSVSREYDKSRSLAVCSVCDIGLGQAIVRTPTLLFL